MGEKGHSANASKGIHMATITFHGASRTVTGACYLFQNQGNKYLLDCGQFQGPWSIEKQNYNPFQFSSSDLKAMILSHGHLDHCGRIPLLAKNGFHASIYSTPPTRDIARLILLDSSHVIKEEFQWRKRRLTRAGIKVAAPLYSSEDVYYSLDHFDKTVKYNEKITLDPRTSLSFHMADAGHILGSAHIYLKYKGNKGPTKTLLYTGDTGDGERPVVNDPHPPEKVDVLIMESTYGNRDHRSYEDSVLEFQEAVASTVKNKGTVLIPSFALERAQEILYHLKTLKNKKIISDDVPVFLNSPLAIDITKVYHKHCNFCRKELHEELSVGKSPFVFPGLYLTESTEESKAIHSVPDPKIVIAGSGMMTGGRIKHHLKHNLWKENTMLVVVGYQAEGTLGRRLVDGEKIVKIFGEEVSVKANICTINGFSAHADRKTLISFAKKASPKKIILVHGENNALSSLAISLKKELPHSEIKIPDLGETIEV